MLRRRLSDEPPLDYARRKATEDVVDTIDWLQRIGFRLVRSWGGADESFGDLGLVFRRRGAEVHILRDRSQWHVLVATEPGRAPAGLPLPPAPPGQPGEPLAEQLPPGVSWREELGKLFTSV